MNKLPDQFTKDDNNFTLVKRTDKTACYKRTTLEGVLVSFEVFAIKSKNDKEVYPEKGAFGKWAWCPLTEAKADTYFNRIETGETVIADYDPETNEMIRDENEQSYEELMAEPETLETPVALVDPTMPEIVAPVLEAADIVGGTTPVVVPSDPVVVQVASVEVAVVAPAEIKADVQTTPDGGAVVTVAKVKKAKVSLAMNIPTGEFTQAQFAVANGMPLRGAVWGRLDALKTEGKIRLVEMRKLGKGRPTAIYAGV